jgi:hypothetical protein
LDRIQVATKGNVTANDFFCSGLSEDDFASRATSAEAAA